MGEAAKKLDPEEEKYYIGRLSKKQPTGSIKNSSKPNLELLSGDELDEEENGEDEYTPPDLQLLDEDQNQAEPSEEEKTPGDHPVQLEGESDADYQQRLMNLGIIPTADIQAEEAAKQAEPVGGEAEKAKTKSPADEKKEKAKDELKDQATKQVKNTVKEATDTAVDAASQTARAAAKAAAEWAAEAAAAAWESIVAATSEFWLPILLGIIGLVIVIFCIVFLVKSLQTPNANGSSPVQPVDVVSDHPLVDSVLALSDPSQLQTMIASNKQNLLTEISNFEQKIKTNDASDPRTATTITQLDAIKTLVSAYSTPDATKAAAIKTALAAAMKPWAVNTNPGGMILPAGKNFTTISKYYNISGGNFHAGVDFTMPIGTPLYAPTSGTVVYLRDNIANYPPGPTPSHKDDDTENGGYGNIMIVKMDSPVDGGTYWECHHLSPNTAKFKINDHVNQGDLIALSGSNGASTGPHLHFEVDTQFCNHSCNTTDGGTDTDYKYTIDPLIPLGLKK